MAETWHSINIYYHDSNKDNLLLDCVRPLFSWLDEHHNIRRAYFTRHWRGGSHLRLQIYADLILFENAIAPYIKGEVEAYLQAWPSMSSLTEEEAQQQHERRNRMGLDRSYTELKANNSLEIAPYEPLAETVGSEGAATLLEEYYITTNELAFQILEQTRNNYTTRLNACFDQLVALVATSPFLRLENAYMSYRSHVEAYILYDPMVEEPRKRRERLARAYEQRHQAIKQRIIRLLTLIEKAPDRLPSWLASTIAIHRQYGDYAFQGAQEGKVRLRTEEEVAAFAQDVPTEESSFRTVVKNNKAVRQFSHQPTMIAHRIAINFLYLQLHRIGMLNEDRYILDYYIATAIEELFNIDPVVAIEMFDGPVVPNARES